MTWRLRAPPGRPFLRAFVAVCGYYVVKAVTEQCGMRSSLAPCSAAYREKEKLKTTRA